MSASAFRRQGVSASWQPADMRDDALPVELPLALREGVGRGFMAKGDGRDGYDWPPKKRPARAQGTCPQT